ncbi:unnamed protein product, partial [marine sediment metagenome]
WPNVGQAFPVFTEPVPAKTGNRPACLLVR